MRGKMLLVFNKVVTARRPECPFNIAASRTSPEHEEKLAGEHREEDKRFAKRVEERAR
jgi:hypothetical protein